MTDIAHGDVSFFSFQDKLEGFDLMLEWIYWSLAVWPVGYFFAFPTGGAMLSYFHFVAFYNLIEIFDELGTWEQWFAGPFRRAVM